MIDVNNDVIPSIRHVGEECRFVSVLSFLGLCGQIALGVVMRDDTERPIISESPALATYATTPLIGFHLRVHPSVSFFFGCNLQHR